MGRINVRAMLPLLALAGTLLACSLSLEPGEDGAAGGAGGDTQAAAPTVWILEPVSGATVPVDAPVDITVETSSTTTDFMLNVGGRVASRKALPPDQSGPAKAILSWTPTGQGTVSLEVIALNGGAASAPAALILEVSGTAGTTSGGVVGCTGRALVSELNYRDGPGTGHTKLGQFDVGESVTVIGRNADSSWYQVQRFNGQQVWTINNAQWMQVEGECSTLPVVG